jgi:hypothetical protein
MNRTIKDFKSFEEAETDEIKSAQSRTPSERIMLLHKLIRAWMKFPRQITEKNNIPTLTRFKHNHVKDI